MDWEGQAQSRMTISSEIWHFSLIPERIIDAFNERMPHVRVTTSHCIQELWYYLAGSIARSSYVSNARRIRGFKSISRVKSFPRDLSDVGPFLRLIQSHRGGNAILQQTHWQDSPIRRIDDFNAPPIIASTPGNLPTLSWISGHFGTSLFLSFCSIKGDVTVAAVVTIFKAARRSREIHRCDTDGRASIENQLIKFYHPFAWRFAFPFPTPLPSHFFLSFLISTFLFSSFIPWS